MLPQLPSDCGTVVRLRYLEELTLLEVAEALEIPVGTVKSRLNYGLTLLRQRLLAETGDANQPTRPPGTWLRGSGSRAHALIDDEERGAHAGARPMWRNVGCYLVAHA